MNPSTEEILRSFENLPTERVVLLPNNKNILLAAHEVVQLTVKQVAVIPTRTIPQGLAAMLVHRPEGDLTEIAQAMAAASQTAGSAEITIATRTVELNGVPVKAGEYIGLLEGQLVAGHDSIAECLMSTLAKAFEQEAEIVTLYYGADLAPREANTLADGVRRRWPGVEVELVDGGQPHYLFLISIE
jgi:dihydroxyacetone kinase-like predicted kinase